MSTITFEWEPDPAVFAQRFYAVAGALQDRTIPLAAASQEMQATIRERFDTQTDPDGQKWADWSERYKPIAKAFPNIGILQRTGELAEVASSSTATVISNDTVYYRTDLLPQYGLAHEAGIPDRGEKGGELPRRSFLGLSEAAAIQIYGYFYEWFEEAIQLYATSTGKIAPRHAIHGAGGLFVPRASVGRGPLPKF